jgi:hypothetical protein
MKHSNCRTNEKVQRRRSLRSNWTRRIEERQNKTNQDMPASDGSQQGFTPLLWTKISALAARRKCLLMLLRIRFFPEQTERMNEALG